MSTIRSIGIGAAAGLAATTAMTAVMLAARELGLLGRLPPHEIASKAVARSGQADEVGADERRTMGWASHFAFGAAAGGVYAALRRIFPTPGPGVLHGALFAAGVWLVSYQGWIPALRLLPPASDDDPERPAAMLTAHVVFGAVLGAITRATRAG